MYDLIMMYTYIDTNIINHNYNISICIFDIQMAVYKFIIYLFLIYGVSILNGSSVLLQLFNNSYPNNYHRIH